MKRSSAALALAGGVILLAIPVAGFASGGGGMGGGGMPSGGGGMGGMGGMDQPAYDPAVEYQHGQSDLQAGKYKDAVRDFSHVVEVAPNAPNAWLYLGMSKSGDGDEKGAEKAYEKSVKLDGGSVQAHRALALSLVKLNQPAKANTELAALKQLDANCANTCSDAADLKAAISAVQGAMAPPAAAPASGPPAGSAPAGSPSAANPAPDHLSLTTPEAGDGAYVRAVSLINERRWDDALASLGKAAAALGPHPDILTYEGYVWRHKGDWAKAEGFYEAALKIDPDHRGATEYYGELKVLKGDLAGAKVMLARLDSVCTYGCAEAEELRLWIDRRGDPAA
ncbi:MAG TPA: tetratricopeptide repeat protein [Caulobacteraceae bacterium]|jgi:tetratricopeptide (TPR) repeat protein